MPYPLGSAQTLSSTIELQQRQQLAAAQGVDASQDEQSQAQGGIAGEQEDELQGTRDVELEEPLSANSASSGGFVLVAAESARMGDRAGKKRKFHAGARGEDKDRKRRRGGIALTDMKTGKRGFLVTFDQGRVRQVRAQMQDWLCDSVEALQGAGTASASGSGIDKAIAAEIALCKSTGRDVEPVDMGSGTRGCQVFMLRDKVLVDPVDVVAHIFGEVSSAGKSRVPGAFTLCPLASCSFATVEDLMRTGAPLLRKHFGAGSGPQKFAIQFRRRMAKSISREEIIAAVGSVIDEAQPPGVKHCVDLTNPDTVVSVEVVKNVAGIAIVPCAGALFGFNLQTAEAAGAAKAGGGIETAEAAGAAKAGGSIAAPAAVADEAATS